jgi:glycosyltransferase involved in cell wall biosynthesis
VTDPSPTPELPPIEERPLVTFALFAYNQEKYIREAVEGAFAQTYEPLEIILSDDCSTDQTFEFIKQMVADYGGSHTIVLNRNNQNLGISAHVRAVHELSKGKFIVHAAGDDISMPERCEVITSAFLDAPRDVYWMVSNGVQIDLAGKPSGLLCDRRQGPIIDRPQSPLLSNLPGVLGCTAAIRRELINNFPPAHKSIVAEDVLLTRRASLLGATEYIPNILVQYRIGSGVGTKKLPATENLKRFSRSFEDQLIRYAQFQKDADHIGSTLDHFTKDLLNRECLKLKLYQKVVEDTDLKALLLVLPMSQPRFWLSLVKTLALVRLQNYLKKILGAGKAYR